jgi:hypothetical protein
MNRAPWHGITRRWPIAALTWNEARTIYRGPASNAAAAWRLADAASRSRSADPRRCLLQKYRCLLRRYRCYFAVISLFPAVIPLFLRAEI